MAREQGKPPAVLADNLGRSSEGIEEVVRTVAVHVIPEAMDLDILEGAEIGFSVSAHKRIVRDVVAADIANLLGARADGVKPDAVAVVIDLVEINGIDLQSGRRRVGIGDRTVEAEPAVARKVRA